MQWGRYGGVDGDTEHCRIFKDPEPASWTLLTDTGMLMSGGDSSG